MVPALRLTMAACAAPASTWTRSSARRWGHSLAVRVLAVSPRSLCVVLLVLRRVDPTGARPPRLAALFRFRHDP